MSQHQSGRITPDEQPPEISHLALKLTKWIGERTTKFVDAALVAGAPVAVAKVTGLLPAIIDSVEAVGRAVGH